MASKVKLFTLTEISKKSGISMPTLQRYKKLYQKRIPSRGVGRKQRYPEEAVAVLQEIKKENLKRRGRRKKAAARSVKKKAAARSVKRPTRKAPRRKRKKVAAAAARPKPELLSLAEIGRRTGISYPTLINYVKKHARKIPHSGKGRRRRFPPAAVEVFEQLRAASPRGRRVPPMGRARVAARRATVVNPALARRVRKLEQAQREVSRQLEAVLKLLKKPIQITVRSR